MFFCVTIKMWNEKMKVLLGADVKFFFLRFIFVYEYFVCMHLYLSSVSLLHEEVRRGTWISGTRVIEYCEPPRACSELNPGALLKLQVLLTTAPSVSLVG